MVTEHTRAKTDGDDGQPTDGERALERTNGDRASGRATSSDGTSGRANGDSAPGRASTAGADEHDDPYEIRLYEPRDRASFLELYDLVLGEQDEAWFAWKYEENPYTDHVPIVLATADGEVVGAKPCFALELRAGSETVIGYQPADVMVHPDHRRRGLYSRTTERMKAHYREREPSLFFNFPNQATLSGSLKHGWQVVEEVPTHYRVQRPAAIVDATSARRTRLARLAQPLADGYHAVKDALAGAPSDVTVERLESVPVETFVDLYERSIPRTLHANRDERFYEWRFENPTWTYDAYVATRDGEAVAGVITGSRVRDGSRITTLTDVVPLGESDGRAAGLHAILARVLADHTDADLVSVSGDVVPETLLERFGFHSDGAFPLARVSSRTTQVAYPIVDDGGHEWTVAGRAIADPANWTVGYAEQDTS